MGSELPSYLKSLEAIIAGSSSAASASASAAPTSVVVAPAVVATPTTVSKSSKKLKFMMVSTHCHQFTGYSKVSHHTLQILSKLPWIDLVHYGFQKFPNCPPGYRVYPPGVEVIDAASLEKEKQQGFG
jgi:hypothetical protein